MLDQLNDIEDMKIHIAVCSNMTTTFRNIGNASDVPSPTRLSFPRLHTLFVPPWLLRDPGYQWFAPQLKHIAVNSHVKYGNEFFATHGSSLRALTFGTGCRGSEHSFLQPVQSIEEVMHDMKEVPMSLDGSDCTRIGVTGDFKFDRMSEKWRSTVELLGQNFDLWGDVKLFPRLRVIRLMGLADVQNWDADAVNVWDQFLSAQVTKGIRVEDRDGRLIDSMIHPLKTMPSYD